MSEAQSIQGFIESEGLTADVEGADSNPHMGDMPSGSTHWRVTIRKGSESMVVPFSQGPAINGEPELATVLDCLASDAASIQDARSFDDWAEEMGYFPMESSEDFRAAERTYHTIEEQANALSRTLGSEAFDELLYGVERS